MSDRAFHCVVVTMTVRLAQKQNVTSRAVFAAQGRRCRRGERRRAHAAAYSPGTQWPSPKPPRYGHVSRP